MPPKWRELADRLTERIKNGEFTPGQQLPHIRDLVEAGEGSKATVHAAYKALEAEGLVTSSRGHGTVVRPQAPLKRLSIERYDKAIADYDQAARLNPAYALAYQNRGIVRCKQKEFAGAAGDFEKLVELDCNQ